MIGGVNIQAVEEVALNGKKAKRNAILFVDPNLTFSDNGSLKILTRIFERMPHTRHQFGHGDSFCLKPQARNIIKIFGLI